MIIIEPYVRFLDLVSLLSEAIDLINPTVANHHKQVAYITFSLAKELNFSPQQERIAMMAASLHDIGAISMEKKIDAFEFDDDVNDNLIKHTEIGYLLLSAFEPLEAIAPLVRNHHLAWNNGQGLYRRGQAVPVESHLIHLAEYVSTLIKKNKGILAQTKFIRSKVQEQSGNLFKPDYVDAFMELSKQEYFWLDLVSLSLNAIVSRRLEAQTMMINLKEFMGFTRFASRIVDFRNPLNANHSSGVAASAQSLARCVGFSEIECLLMESAGYLHDLGKLAVAPSILGKPKRLTTGEFGIIKCHSYHTFRMLGNIKQLDIVNAWASFHHERLDGSGYPFHLKEKELPLGSQIMAVADIFTAISEDRPYRAGMSKDRALNVLDDMVKQRAINGELVGILNRHFDEINQCRIVAQTESAHEYLRFTNPIIYEKSVNGND